MNATPQTLASWFEANGHRGPSFDMIRLFAAFLVLFSHSSLITASPSMWPVLVTRQMSPGGLAVAIFFVLSGYVITESYRSDPRPADFVRKRILRIYPALIVVVLCTVFLYGPLMTELPLSAYWSNKGTAIYLLSMIFPMKSTLPGVFDHANVYYVNASLWTLRYEIVCYAGLALFGSVLLARRSYVLALTVALTLAAAGAPHLIDDRYLRTESLQSLFLGLPLIPYFLGGTCVALFADKLPVNRMTIAAAAVVVALALEVVGIHLVFPFVGAYLIAVLGNSNLLAFPSLRTGIFAGDFSYGVYIIAFPVQQAVNAVVGGGAWWTNFLISAPIVFGLAMLSWHFIEKPFLRLKYARIVQSQKAA